MNRTSVILLSVLIIGIAGVIFWLGDRNNTEFSPKPQTPKPPFAYDVEHFSVPVIPPDVVLDGTLTLPAGEGPFPVAILLSVAGPNDRDQAFAGHAGFHVLADHLTRNGIAVARFDDRGFGQSTGDYFDASWDDLAADALSVAAHLKVNQRIDDAHIGYIGMSQGGAVGALSAAADKDVAFLVLLSAPGLPGEEALAQQLEKTLDVSGISGAPADQYRDLFQEFMGIVKSDPEDTVTIERMRTFLNGPGRALIPPYRFMPKNADGLIKVLLGPWYQSNVHFDPLTAYGSLHIPVLAIGGEKDFVAPPRQHLVNIERILADAPTTDVTINMMPGLNHLLQQAETGLPTEYAALENSISPQVLEAVSSWIEERTGATPAPLLTD